MRNMIFIVFLFTAIFGSVSAQDLTMPELQGYKKIMNYPVFGPENLWDFINGAADTYLSYGFIDLHVAEYKKGKNVIKLEIYRHTNSTMAFGIYSSERSSSFRFLNLGSQGYITTDGSINFFKGSYYTKIRTYSKNESTLKSAQALAQKVAAMLAGGSEMPSAISQFPEAGKKVNEETFINESVLGHKFLNNAFKATYVTGNDIFSIFLIENKTPEDTRQTVESYLKTTGTESMDSETGKYMLKDGYNGTIFLAWKETRIVIVSGLSKDQADVADRYISEIFR